MLLLFLYPKLGKKEEKMRDILYIGADKYYNLKADMAPRNKIDAVNFELNTINKDYDEIYKKELKLYEFNDRGEVGVENNVLKFASYVNEWKDAEGKLIFNDFTLGDLTFTDKIFCAKDGTNVYIAVIVEPQQNFVYDTKLDVFVEEIYSVKDSLGNTPIETPHPWVSVPTTMVDENIPRYKQPVIGNLTGLSANAYSVKYINEKQALLLMHAQIQPNQDSVQYTKSINIRVSAGTWSAKKDTVYYVLDENENAVLLEQNPDGTFKGKTPRYPFKYTTNELLSYNTKYSTALLHQRIAKELLEGYKYGRKSVEFELEDTELGYGNYHGDYNDSIAKKPVSALQIGDVFLLHDINKDEFVGGVYRKSIELNSNIPGAIRSIQIPRQYQITTIEYCYDGTMSYRIEALEVPFSAAMDTSLANGKFEYHIDEDTTTEIVAIILSATRSQPN